MAMNVVFYDRFDFLSRTALLSNFWSEASLTYDKFARSCQLKLNTSENAEVCD